MLRYDGSKGVSRRVVLKGAAALGGSAVGSSVGGFPTVWAQNIKDVVLRHAGPPVTAIPRIAEQATKDLGFTVQMQASENAGGTCSMATSRAGPHYRTIRQSASLMWPWRWRHAAT